jgi:hypothetical protein
MPERTLLQGRYVIVDEPLLREKASRLDPRGEFYHAMLRHRTYEGYLAEVGRNLVEVPNYTDNPISGRAEILYCRRNGWIEDES